MFIFMCPIRWQMEFSFLHWSSLSNNDHCHGDNMYTLHFHQKDLSNFSNTANPEVSFHYPGAHHHQPGFGTSSSCLEKEKNTFMAHLSINLLGVGLIAQFHLATAFPLPLPIWSTTWSDTDLQPSQPPAGVRLNRNTAHTCKSGRGIGPMSRDPILFCSVGSIPSPASANYLTAKTCGSRLALGNWSNFINTLAIGRNKILRHRSVGDLCLLDQRYLKQKNAVWGYGSLFTVRWMRNTQSLSCFTRTLLQPLLENASKYVLRFSQPGKRNLCCRSNSGTHLVIQVANSGRPFD